MNKLVSRIAALCMLVLSLVALSGCEEATYYYTIAPTPAPAVPSDPEVVAPEPDIVFKNMSVGSDVNIVVPGQRKVVLAKFQVIKKSANTPLQVHQLAFNTNATDMPSWMLFSSVEVIDDLGHTVADAYTKYSRDGNLLVDFNTYGWYPVVTRTYSIVGNLPTYAPLEAGFHFEMVGTLLGEYGLVVSGAVQGPHYVVGTVAGVEAPVVMSNARGWLNDLTAGTMSDLASVTISCPASALPCSIDSINANAYGVDPGLAFARIVETTPGGTMVSALIQGERGVYSSRYSFPIQKTLVPGASITVEFMAVPLETYLSLDIVAVNATVGGVDIVSAAATELGSLCDTVLRSMTGATCIIGLG